MYSGDQPGFMARSRFQPIPGFLMGVLISDLSTFIIPIIIQAVNRENRLDRNFFMGMIKDMRGRPPKKPGQRKTASMKIPLTDEEKGLIRSAAEADGAKPVTWARTILLKAAKRRRR